MATAESTSTLYDELKAPARALKVEKTMTPPDQSAFFEILEAARDELREIFDEEFFEMTSKACHDPLSVLYCVLENMRTKYSRKE